ncbi:hypothetical protein GCM10023200_20340 [Actinomycetospora chlora]|uniref:Uncharacterized protein n=1 Tax=Actinomycetospora chlora TaxID=663608 RepID=A0ABP9AU74_9PSEU
MVERAGGRAVVQVKPIPRQATAPGGDVPRTSWSNGVVRHFLLGPLWESRRAHVFDQWCPRA